MTARSLNGRWIKRDDEKTTVFVEKTFKKGYVTGFQYIKIADGEVHSPYKATFEELREEYIKL